MLTLIDLSLGFTKTASNPTKPIGGIILSQLALFQCYSLIATGISRKSDRPYTFQQCGDRPQSIY
ncbi:hypothetical protein IQ268_19575 [Oculatella sp. LEGE 06141]|uniref:hypothetical protein n=1 Tax=Oculatella sp. LEGE 06141 TaxID=1828648 RepID=UPI00187F7705|nr:hypothetical protein [Oculatella sp. LEGE 06141]MBE9180764.1 hypothetical protein [Oculatella sp. LEGE 06141]